VSNLTRNHNERSHPEPVCSELISIPLAGQPSETPETQTRGTRNAQKTQKQQNPRYYRLLAGYILGRETALKLGCLLRGIDPIFVASSDKIPYRSPNDLEDSLRTYLASRGQKGRIAVDFVGEAAPFDAIVLTRRSYHRQGHVPEVVEAEKGTFVREWLESKGNVSPSLDPPRTTFLPCLQESVRKNIGGRSALKVSRSIVLCCVNLPSPRRYSVCSKPSS